MCGRATLVTVDPHELAEIFGLDEVPEMPPRFNIAPSQPLPIVRTPGRLDFKTWGVPGRRFINAKIENASTKPENRCLVILDGFYEWRKSDRQPFYFHRVDGKPFAMGGLLVQSDYCVIATATPVEGISDIHDRMPVVLARDDWGRWLAGEKPRATLQGMERYPVGPLVSSPKNDEPACIAPIIDVPIQRGLFEP